jgi:hypothetical protein
VIREFELQQQTKAGRILLLSLRGLVRHVSRCSGNEFEDVIGECDSVSMIAPSTPHEMGYHRIVRGIKRICGMPSIEHATPPDEEFDLLFVICHSFADLRYLHLIKRSNYFVAYPPKFDRPDETGGEQELAPRFFEGAAGGAVLVGRAPDCEAYMQCFDWPDAVIPAPENSKTFVDIISALQKEPRSVDRMRSEGVTQCLRRHDWVYRWEQILNTVGLAHPSGIVERKRRLRKLAELVEQESAAAAGQNVSDAHDLAVDMMSPANIHALA